MENVSQSGMSRPSCLIAVSFMVAICHCLHFRPAYADIILQSYTDINFSYRLEGPSRPYMRQRPVECEEIYHLHSVASELNDFYRRKTQERSIAIDVNDDVTVKQLSKELRSIAIRQQQNMLMLQVLEAEPLFLYLNPIPGSARLRFIMAPIEGAGKTWNQDEIIYKAVYSRLPVAVSFGRNSFYRGSPFRGPKKEVQKIEAPKPPAQSYNSIDPFATEMSFGVPVYQQRVLAPITLDFETDPAYYISRCNHNLGQCSLYAYTEVRLDLYQGQLCRNARDEKGSVLRYTIVYNSKELGSESVEVTYHLGYNISAQNLDIREDRESENRAIDRLLKDFLIDIFGEVKLYRVSDELMGRFRGPDPVKLRGALDLMNERLSQLSGTISNEKIVEYFRRKVDRYQNRGPTTVAFVFEDPKSKAEISFVRVSGDLFHIVGITFNGEELLKK